MIGLLKKLIPRRRSRRDAASGPRVALVGNIANNAFNMVNILRRQGIAAQLIDDGTNTFSFSRPAWEECDATLSYAEVMQSPRTPADWARLERKWGWQNGGRVVQLWASARPNRSLSSPNATSFQAEIDAALARSGLDGPDRAFLRDVVSCYGATIRTLRDYDVVIAFGFLAAACAYLAERPTLYFTYGGDCRVDLADRDGSRTTLSRVFAHILASERFAIEGYGCDREIHNILRRRGLLNQVAYAFVPNCNVALLRQSWDRRSARAVLEWPADKTIFFLASRVDYAWKRSDVFLDAFAQYAAAHDDVLLAITGWGNDYLDARQRMARKELRDKVVFLKESFSKLGLFRRYAAADVVVDQFQVGSLGSVSYEAMCMGKPVLTYLAPFNLLNYPSPPPILNARTQADIVDQLEFCACEREALERIGRESARWYAEVYAETNLASSVRTIAESGTRKWIVTSDFRNQALPRAEIPISGHRATVRILPWPYPFRAGFTLANDCEYFAWEDFCAIYRWLNGTGTTRLGPGLGLPVSASFWFFSEDPENLGVSYFEGDDWRKKSHAAPHLAELLRIGFLDTLHSYGGFDLRGGFRREHAVAAVEELNRIGARPMVWTNHGNASNVQNLGGLWANDYARGDDPDHPAYHGDLLARAGFRYFWLDAYATNRFSLGNPQGRRHEDGLAADEPGPWGDRILCADRLRDGRAIVAFRRFRGKRRWAPDPTSLADQLSPRNLDHLESSGGAVILYQHLGCFRQPDGSAVRGRLESFPPPAIRQLEDLAARYRAGRIWIAPCASFLRYVETIGELRLDVEPAADGVAFVLSGHQSALEERDLAGVSLSVRGSVRCAGVEMADDRGVRSPCRMYAVRHVGPDETLISWPLPAWPEFPFDGKETT